MKRTTFGRNVGHRSTSRACTGGSGGGSCFRRTDSAGMRWLRGEGADGKRSVEDMEGWRVFSGSKPSRARKKGTEFPTNRRRPGSDWVRTEWVTACRESGRLTVADSGTYGESPRSVTDHDDRRGRNDGQGLGHRRPPCRMGRSTAKNEAMDTASVTAIFAANKVQPCRWLTCSSQRKRGQ